MKHVSLFLCAACCLLCIRPCFAAPAPAPVDENAPDANAAVDQKTADLLSRVLHSKEGVGVKPATVIYMIPYVRPANLPPLKPHTRVPYDKLYLITSADMFYSFLLTPKRIIPQWQAKLVPQNDKTAMKPIGSIGLFLLKQYKAIPNSVSGGKHADGGAFLRDIELQQPLIIYHVAKGKLVRDGELHF